MSPLNMAKTSLIILVAIALLTQNEVVLVRGGLTFIGNSCELKSGNYSRSDVDNFTTNLEDVTTTISKDALRGAFFSNASAGSGTDQVFGLYYCDGAIDASDCNACVVAATRKIRESCNTKEAIVWYLGCTLRYANRYINSEVEVWPYVEVSSSPGRGLRDVEASTMRAAMKEAAYNTMSHPPAYAVAQADITGSTHSLVAMAQCTPDIVGPACAHCLMEAASAITASAVGGAAVFLPSCHLRYAYHSVSMPTATPINRLQPQLPYILSSELIKQLR